MMGEDNFDTLETAEGFYRITTFGVYKSWKVSLLLMFRYGFWRWGFYMPPIAGEGIFPNFRRGRLNIYTGYDDWFGYDWFARDAESDRFLRKFYEKHLSK